MEELARSLDLNTLHDLSRTCRLFRANLLQFRKQLKAKALRCVNDQRQVSHDGPDRAASPHQRAWQIYGYSLVRPAMTNGRIGPCARDLVSECRRCGIAVCRNCTTKPPSAVVRPDRLRRLCRACAKAGLLKLVAPYLTSTNHQAFTREAFTRGPCSCTESVFICQPCGRAIAHSDTDYKRIWTWRTRYSTYLGGLGTGIGEGNEGVQCARGENCLNARNIEVEMDYDGTPDEIDSRPTSTQLHSNGNSGPDPLADSEKAGYFRQEMEGIGGTVRGKCKKMVRVGRTVEEYEDERDTGEYLGREARREHRSWCGWCDRMVLGRKDKRL